MAYAFTSIRNSLGQDEPQKSDIFAPQAQTNQDAAQTGQAGQQQQTKTSTDAELGGAGGGSSQPQGQQPSLAQQSTEVVSRNVGKTQNPALLAKTQKSVADADQAVQDEANSYIQNAKNTSYSAKPEDIDKYINQGDQDAGTAITGLLGRTADKAEAYKTKQDLSLGNVDKLQSDAGIQQALRNEGGQDYTAGMGAFDLAALKRTPGFDTIRQTLAQKKQALLDREAGYENATTGKSVEAQEALDANLKAAKEDLRGKLGSRATDLQAAEEQKAAALNAQNSAGKNPFIDAQALAARQALANESPAESRMKDMLLNSGVNATQFYSAPEASWRDAISAEDASKFNRINAALGRSDPDSIYAAGTAPTQNFDLKGYRDAVTQNETGVRAAKDQGEQAQIDAILKSIQARYNPQLEQQNEMAAENDRLKGLYGDVYGQQAAIDPNQYNQAFDWHSLISGQDASALNPLYQDLGQNGVAAGQGLGVGGFDRAAYGQALQAALEQKRADAAKAAKEAAAQERIRAQTAENNRAGVGPGQVTGGGPVTAPNLPVIAQKVGSVASKVGLPSPQGILGLPAPKSDFKNLKESLAKRRFF